MALFKKGVALMTAGDPTDTLKKLQAAGATFPQQIRLELFYRKTNDLTRLVSAGPRSVVQWLEHAIPWDGHMPPLAFDPLVLACRALRTCLTEQKARFSKGAVCIFVIYAIEGGKASERIMADFIKVAVEHLTGGGPGDDEAEFDECCDFVVNLLNGVGQLLDYSTLANEGCMFAIFPQKSGVGPSRALHPHIQVLQQRSHRPSSGTRSRSSSPSPRRAWSPSYRRPSE